MTRTWFPHPELHRVRRTGWLRAAVLGADDGIVSTSSLILGVAASNVSRAAVVVAGFAALAAGAFSMAAGEYDCPPRSCDEAPAGPDKVICITYRRVATQCAHCR